MTSESRASDVIPSHGGSRRGLRILAAAIALALTSVSLLTLIEDPVLARAATLAAAYLVLSLTEVVPPFVLTIFLLAAVPLALGPIHPRFGLTSVLKWPAEPVLALFAGGLALGLAAHRHGLDTAIASGVLRVARGGRRTLLALVLGASVFLSMWMSNIAAAAVMLAALRPILRHAAVHDRFRKALLLAIAMGSNLGGITTPIATGPNAIATAAVEERHAITFLGWMGFALPLVLGMLAVAFAMLAVRYGVHGVFAMTAARREPLGAQAKVVVGLFTAAICAWVLEPVHGISAPLVALSAMVLLFGFDLLRRSDLQALDWSTLGLIAGGVTLGRLIEQTGLFAEFVQAVDWGAQPRFVWLGTLVLACALFSAVMSNTATGALLIPLALTIDPAPSTGIIVAIAASFGVPFAISTPPNALVYGEGDLTPGDLLWIGLPLMLLGCSVITLTGTPALRLLGVP